MLYEVYLKWFIQLPASETEHVRWMSEIIGEMNSRMKRLADQVMFSAESRKRVCQHHQQKTLIIPIEQLPT